MTGVHERVRAVLEMVTELLRANGQLHQETMFAQDARLASFRTYDVLRHLLLIGMRNLKLGAELSQQQNISTNGTHLIVLRPALVSFSKALWMLTPDDPRSRIQRAAGIVVADRRHGRKAMEAAARSYSNQAFAEVGAKFEQGEQDLRAKLQLTELSPQAVPFDGNLVEELGAAIDDYYGLQGSAKQDALLLWNASSSLSHGERWFSQLYQPLANTFSERSLDVICSGFSVLHLRTLHMLVDRTSTVHFPKTPLRSNQSSGGDMHIK